MTTDSFINQTFPSFTQSQIDTLEQFHLDLKPKTNDELLHLYAQSIYEITDFGFDDFLRAKSWLISAHISSRMVGE